MREDTIKHRNELAKKSQRGEITPTELWKRLKASWEFMSAEEKARDKARAENTLSQINAKRLDMSKG